MNVSLLKTIDYVYEYSNQPLNIGEVYINLKTQKFGLVRFIDEKNNLITSDGIFYTNNGENPILKRILASNNPLCVMLNSFQVRKIFTLKK